MKKEKTDCGAKNTWWSKQMPLKTSHKVMGKKADENLKGKQMYVVAQDKFAPRMKTLQHEANWSI